MRMYFDFSGDFSKVDREEICFGAIEFDFKNRHYVVDILGESEYDFAWNRFNGRFKGDYELLNRDTLENLLGRPITNDEIEHAILNMDTFSFQFNVLDDGKTLNYDKLEITIEIDGNQLTFTRSKDEVTLPF